MKYISEPRKIPHFLRESIGSAAATESFFLPCFAFSLPATDRCPRPGCQLGGEGRGEKFLHSLLGGEQPVGHHRKLCILVHFNNDLTKKYHLVKKFVGEAWRNESIFAKHFVYGSNPWGGEDTAEGGIFFRADHWRRNVWKHFFPFCPRKFLREPTGLRSKFGKKRDNTKFRTKDAFVPLGSLI